MQPTMLARIVEKLQGLTFGWRRGGSAQGLASSLVDALKIADPEGTVALELARRIARKPGDVGNALRDAISGAASLEPLMLDVAAVAMRRRATLPLVSLGSHCYTSAMLRRWGLRPWAGPFDWLFSAPAMVAHCIDDDFRLLLDRDQYEPVPTDQRPAGPLVNRVHHREYRRIFGVDYIFNHHDVHLDADYGYLTRCVQRFRAALDGQHPHAFVLTCWHNERVAGDIERISQAIRARSGIHRLIVFSITEPSGIAVPRLSRLPAGEEFAHLVEPCSRWEPLIFPDLLDEYALVQAMVADCGRFPNT